MLTTSKKFFCLASLIVVAGPALTTRDLRAQARRRFAVPDDVSTRKVNIYSEGTRMSGNLFVPKSAKPGDKLPTIVMAHGWGGEQRSLRRDAAEFAEAGYFVLTFDYRGWGTSDSRVILTKPAPDVKQVNFTAEVRAVREVVDPLDMGTDWLNALHWVHGEPQVDTARIGIWGSSMAGSLVIYAASHDPRVKAVHSQVTGTLSGRAWGRSARSRADATKRARGEAGYPEPGARMGKLKGMPITNRFADYVPIKEIQANDKVALQFVLSEKEEYLNNEEHGILAYKNHRGPKNLVIIPDTTHYDIYRKARAEAHRLALAWFDKHLRGKAE